MDIKVNLTDIPSNDVPVGVYLMRVEKMVVEASKRAPGAQKLATQFVIIDGEYSNRKAFDNFSLQPQALWRLRDFVNACGVFPGPEGFKTEELIGKVVRVSRVEETGADGKARVKNSDYMPAS